jgi:pimeloyl-ACP methyl ester carboxylesterase
MPVEVSDYTTALIDGPWEHQFVSANGSRFHLAIAGQSGAPLVVLVHSFGQFWWAWRKVIEPVAMAGYRVAALDLRGVAASDKPPSGYDIPTRTRDIAAVIRSLGYSHAVVVGHGTGGEAAWAMGALQPSVTAGICGIASPHPARLHTTFLSQLTPYARRAFAFAQVPTLPERRLRDTDALGEIFLAGRRSTDREVTESVFTESVIAKYREVILIPFAAHTSVESLRWIVRSSPRPDGLRYRSALRRPLGLPVLQLQGMLDGFINVDVVSADSAALFRSFRYEQIDDGGHFLPEEQPDFVAATLIEWLSKAYPSILG